MYYGFFYIIHFGLIKFRKQLFWFLYNFNVIGFEVSLKNLFYQIVRG